MTYVIRVIGPSGAARYLTADQREVESSQDAEQFADADEAQAAADAYLDVARKCWPCPPLVLVSNTEEP